MKNGKYKHIRLSKNFTLDEFAVSKDFPEEVVDIYFSEVEQERIRMFVLNTLQPLRDYLKVPIEVTSGKRTTKLNQKVHGANYSHHLFIGDTGAIDIVPIGCALSVAVDWLDHNAVFAYIISYTKDGFIHISFPIDSTTTHRITYA